VTPELLDWVRAGATRWDRGAVTRADTDRLAAEGLYALYGPPEVGGVPPAEQRAATEALSGASPDLWFVWFQHGPTLRTVASNPELAGWVPELASGRTQAGVAFSHLRGGKPSISARRTDGGWRFDGRQPWCTGWGLADVFLTGAHDADSGDVLLALVPADTPGLASGGELDLLAVRGTSTHALRLDDVQVPDDAVVVRRSYDEWSTTDRAVNSNVQASTFGIASAALDLLDDAGRLRERLDEIRTAAYRLMDEEDPFELVDERLALRAQALVHGMVCASAAVAARGGRAMDLGDRAQLLLRAATFQLVHAQAPHVRAATLSALGV
jgi:alkylation response protein AidB-like acyl-CoA dehydrogenase